MLKINDLHLQVDGDQGKLDLLNGVTLDVPDGRFIVITGPNGGGKTTLAKTIMGLYQPTGGSIEYNGTEYLVLLPAEDDSAEIVILAIEPVDEETENYLSVEDQETLDAVYGIFKERFKDVFTFEG